MIVRMVIVAAMMDAAVVTTAKMVSWLPRTTLVTCSGVTPPTRSRIVEPRLQEVQRPPLANRSSRILGSSRMKSSAWVTTGYATTTTTPRSTAIVANETRSDARMRFQR